MFYDPGGADDKPDRRIIAGLSKTSHINGDMNTLQQDRKALTADLI